MDKEAIYKRALEKHSPAGRVTKALDKVFNTSYAEGTNLILEYLKEFIGMEYGAKDMWMDNVVDCAELPRITFYIWYGIDIGNFSDAQYKRGTFITKDFNKMSECRSLDLAFYHTSSKKTTGHVAIIYDSQRIFQSGAATNKSLVNFSPIDWLPTRKTADCFMGVKRYLTDEQYNDVIVQKVQFTRILKRVIPWRRKDYMHGEDVREVQTKLKELGFFNGALGGNYGPITRAAVRAWQRSLGLPRTGVIDKSMWDRLV